MKSAGRRLRRLDTIEKQKEGRKWTQGIANEDLWQSRQ
jgi:hypothetical protein